MANNKAEPGDIIVFRRLGYAHYAVMGFEGYMYHVKVDASMSEIMKRHEVSALVEKKLIRDSTFARLSYKISVDNAADRYFQPLEVDEIIARAESLVGYTWTFDVVKNNCEHFAKLCRYGKAVSQQVPYTYDEERQVGAGVGSLTAGPIRVEGPSAHLGVRHDNENRGVTAETTFAAAEVGPVGAGVSTGVHASDEQVGFEVLGTGLSIGREVKISLLGSSLGFRLF